MRKVSIVSICSFCNLKYTHDISIIYLYRVYESEAFMRKRINISLDQETAEQIKKLAEKSHMNVSQWITHAVWEEETKNKIKEKEGVK